MAIRIAINGFGRIGRNFLRAALNAKDIEIVAANDLGAPKLLAHLLRYDSVFGRFDGTVNVTQDEILVKNHPIKVFSERDPAQLPWSKLDIDIAMEATGIFRDRDKAAMHLDAGAKKVIITAPGRGEDAMFVLGVNHGAYDPDKHHVVSNASCTTNCLAPVIKVLLDTYGIQYGFMSTIHGYTADQRLLDAIHRDYRRARAAAINIIPTTTGAANAIIRIYPQLKGKLSAMAYRVPVPNGSLVDPSVTLEKSTTKDELNATFQKAATTTLKGILEYTEEPIVSTDIIGNPHSSIFDAQLTQVLEDNFAHVVSHYDNEYAYSVRLVELAQLIGSKL